MKRASWAKLGLIALVALTTALVFAFASPAQAVIGPSVSGTVTDADTGFGIEGVDAVLWEYDAVEGWWVDVYYTSTDIDGWYTMTYSLKSGSEYYVEFYHPAYMSDGTMSQVFSGSPLTFDASLTPLQLAASGTITDVDTGDPVWDEPVTLFVWDAYYEEWAYASDGWTDEMGYYEIYATVDPGTTYKLIAGSEGGAYLPLESPEFTDADMPYTWDAALEAAEPTFMGTVVDANTGAPVEWTGVDLMQEFTEVAAPASLGTYWEYIDWTETDEFGEYVFYDEPVDGGKYRVDVSGAYRYENGSSAEYTYSIGDELPIWLDVELVPWEKIATGLVTKLGDSSVKLEGAWVELYKHVDAVGMVPAMVEWEWIDGAEANEFGRYNVYGPAGAGTYKLWADQWTEYTATETAPFDYDGVTVTKDIALAPATVSVDGTVYDIDTDAPIADAWVTLHTYDVDMGEWWEVDSTWTDVDGAYAFKDLAAGRDYYVSALREWDYLRNSTEPFVYAGTPVTCDLALSKAPVDATGTIYDGGQPPAEPTMAPAGAVTPAETLPVLPGAWVSLSQYIDDPDFGGWWASVQWTESDENGKYQLYGLSDGPEYMIEADKRGWMPNSTETFFFTGMPVVYDLTLYAKGLLTGTATAHRDGSVVESATARLYQEFDDGVDTWWEWVDSCSTYADGKYSLYGEGGGNFYVEVEHPSFAPTATAEFAWDGFSDTTKDAVLFDKKSDRVAGGDRYTTAVEIAKNAFDPYGDGTWNGVYGDGVTHIVIASGDPGAAADPLAAAGLCGTYGAPLFLVQPNEVPQSVLDAIVEIAAANGGEVTVHIVGGSRSVPDDRFYEIADALDAEGYSAIDDRILDGGGRFDLSAAIAKRMLQESGDTSPRRVLIANGADSTKFFDALALSPIAARNSFPILLVSANAVPAPTQALINKWRADNPELPVIIGGGPNTVSDAVKKTLKAERWAGDTRYTTALTIADKAVANDFLGYETVGIAAKLPDALTGGSVVGLQGGPLVLTDGASLTSATGAWLDLHSTDVQNVMVFGGERSMTPACIKQIEMKLK